MKEEDEEDTWIGVKFSEAEMIRLDQTQEHLLVPKRTLNFNEGGRFDELEDSINTLDADNRRDLIAVGTEQGRIFVINFKKNKVHMCVQGEEQVESAILCGEQIYSSSGEEKTIQGYSNRATPCRFRLRCVSKREAYSSKGIHLSKIDKKHNILANTGYLTFKIFHSITKKVLRSFDIKDLFHQYRMPSNNPHFPLVLLNYTLIESSRMVALLVERDHCLYFFDYFLFQLLPPIELSKPKDFGSTVFLQNTVMMSNCNYFIVILQFSKNQTRKVEKKTRLYVCRVGLNQGVHATAEMLFYCDLDNVETIIANDITKLDSKSNTNFREGFVIVLGTVRGVSRVYHLDLENKSCRQFSEYRKCPKSRFVSCR